MPPQCPVSVSRLSTNAATILTVITWDMHEIYKNGILQNILPLYLAPSSQYYG